MNNREFTKKANKNQFSTVVAERKAQAKVVKVKKILSPEKIAEKEAGYQLFVANKQMRKLLRSKNHSSAD